MPQVTGLSKRHNGHLKQLLLNSSVTNKPLNRSLSCLNKRPLGLLTPHTNTTVSTKHGKNPINLSGHSLAKDTPVTHPDNIVPDQHLNNEDDSTPDVKTFTPANVHRLPLLRQKLDTGPFLLSIRNSIMFLR